MALATGLTAAATISSAAHAQGLPDLSDSVTRSDQINRAAQDALRTARPVDARDGSAIDGEAGIYVLSVNDIFRISASGVAGYT
jgi:hypothetical protein